MANNTPQNTNGGFYNDLYNTLKGLAAGALGKDAVMAISARAKRSISMYRVLISSSIVNEELAVNIGKYIECMCSIFTIIASGYNPLAKTNGDIDDIISSISAESFSELGLDKQTVKETILKSMEYFNTEFDTASEKSVGKYSRIGAGARNFSTEARDNSDGPMNWRIPRHQNDKKNNNNNTGDNRDKNKYTGNLKDETALKDAIYKIQMEIMNDKVNNYSYKDEKAKKEFNEKVDYIKSQVPPKPEGMSDSDYLKKVGSQFDLDFLKWERNREDERARSDLRESMKDTLRQMEEDDIKLRRHQQLVDINKANASARYHESRFLTNIEDVTSRATPTVVELRLATPEGTVNIPLAIKANCYGIREDEMKLLLESVIEEKILPNIRKLKWKSGEITTLQYLFNTDLAEKERQLYKTMGRNPWYIDLMTRKAASRGNWLLKNFLKSNPKVRDNVGNLETAYDSIRSQNLNLKGDIPPTATIVAAIDDLVAASGLERHRFLNNDTFIKKIMNKLFLLCFCVVDTIGQYCYFYFSGYSKPFVYSYEDLSKASKNTNKLFAESIHKLSSKL